MKPSRVLVADPHPLLRAGMASVISALGPPWEICGTAINGHEAVAQCGALAPDIVILDYEMPLVNGLEAARQIKRRQRDIEILMFVDTAPRRPLLKICDFDSIVSGSLLKAEAGEELIPALESLRQQRHFRSRQVTQLCRKLVPGDRSGATEPLTKRELEVLCLIVVEQKSSKEIATQLHITCKTVEGHRAELRRKLRVKSAAGLVLYAVRNGIVDL